MIFWTHHAMVATPHHRNKEAMADTLRVFTGDPAKAEALVRKQQASLIDGGEAAAVLWAGAEAGQGGAVRGGGVARRPAAWVGAAGRRAGPSAG